MATKKPFNLYYTFLCFLFFNSIYSFGREIESKAKYEIIENDWELIEYGWPIEDIADAEIGKKTQFYYLKNQASDSIWRLRPSAFPNITNETIFFKLSFKYWAYVSDSYKPNTIVKYNDKADYISEKYIKSYANEWMPCEYILSYQNLTSFQIQNFKYRTDDAKSLIAFKDVRVEYEQQSSNSNILFDIKTLKTDQNPPEIYKIGWNIYEPPHQPTDDFLFFSECVDGCSIKLNKDYLIQVEKNNNKTAKSYQITFEYWLKGKSEIIWKPNNPRNLPDSDWTPIKPVELKNSDEFTLGIQTDKNSESFVAIRNLNITIIFKDNSSIPALKCDEQNCAFSHKGSIWSKNFKHLTEGQFYYPKAKNNSVNIMKSYKTKDVTLTLEYWTLKDSLIKVMYSSRDENIKNTILTIKPQTQNKKKIQRLEKTEFFLGDLIAVRDELFTISVVIEFPDNNYDDCLSYFAMNISCVPNNDNWKFEEHNGNYLKPVMNKETWIKLTGAEYLTAENNLFRFTANAESKTPASAHLLSSVWVKYDESLHLVDPQYSIKVDDRRLWSRFTVRPKVCDWLGHCSDVIQELKNDNEQNQIFSFKFNRLRSPNYIKLLFYIEYFQSNEPSDSSEIKFDLELIHFGDPCFLVDKCMNHADTECLIDEKNAIPNYYNCGKNGNCIGLYTGERCEIYDSCSNVPKGKEYCDSQFKAKCRPLVKSKDFACLCNTSENGKIISGQKPRECQSPKISTKLNWKVIPDVEYYPTESKNSLIYEFQNIDSKSDVCITMKFVKSNDQKDILMNVIYSNGKKIFNMVKFNLLKNSEKLDFCVRDFIYYLDENFSISIEIIGINQGNEEGKIFKMTSFISQIKEFKPVKYIENWSKWGKSGANPAISQRWKTFPAESLKSETGNNGEFYIHFQPGNENVSNYKAMFTSRWIEPDNNFRKMYFYDVEYKNNFDKNKCKIVQITVLGDNGTPIQHTSNDASKSLISDSITISKSSIIEIPQNLKTPFRISFEIEYSINDPKNSFEFWIKNLALGDPCYKYGEETNTECMDSAVCIPLGPETYNCNMNGETEILNSTKTNICFQKYDDKILNHQYCQNMTSLVTESYTKCIPKSNNSFECGCVEGDFYWDQTSKRCVRNGYSLKSETCQGKTCTIFDLSDNNIKYSNKNIPWIDSKKLQNLPFYHPTKNNSGLKIRVRDLKNDEDACFKLSHFIGQKSNLGISYGQSNQLFFSPLQMETTDWKFHDEEFCARSLINDDGKSIELTISALMNDALNDTVAFKFSPYDEDHEDFVYLIKNSDVKFTNDIPYLTLWSLSDEDKEFRVDNQWVLRMPQELWPPTTLSDDIIEFSADSKSPIKQKAFIMSNRLRKDLDSNQLIFNLESDSQFKNLVLKIKILDDNLNLIKEDYIVGDQKINSKVNNTKIGNPITYSVPKTSSNFRIIFEVEYFIADSSKAHLKLSKINLGDPCIGQKLSYVCANGAKCNRLGPGNGFNCNCSEKSWTGKLCEQRDYCNWEHEINGQTTTGKKYCIDSKAGNCQYTKDSFICQCSKGKYWSKENYKCEDYPKCFTHVCDYKTQKCNEPEPGNDKSEAYCTCLDTYVNLAINSSTPICEKFNVCNETHRKASKIPKYENNKACEDPNEICVMNGNNPDDHLCLCPEGYERVGEKSCQPVFCLFSDLNQCKQICGYDDSSPKKLKCSCQDTDIYNVQGNDCIIKPNKTCDCKEPAFCVGTKCHCKYGYKEKLINGKNDGCEPDDSVNFHPWICPEAKKNVTNKSVCDCGENFVLDTTKNTCKLRPVCGKGGTKRAECDKMNALCNFKNGDFTCEDCPVGKVMSSNPVNKTCVDFCYENYEECEKKNADCNPLGYDKSHEKCICKPGLVWKDKQMCVIPRKTVEFQLSIKNDLEKFRNNYIFFSSSDSSKRLVRYKRQAQTNSQFYLDPNSFINDIKSKDQLNDEINKASQRGLEQYEVQQLIGSLIQKIIPLSFSVSAERLNVETCTLNSKQFYDCKVLISLEKTSSESLDQFVQNLQNSMNESCIGDEENCFFKIEKSILIVSRNSLKSDSFKIYKPCEGDRKIKNCPYYASCKPHDDSTVYSCLCDQNVFINKTTNHLEVEAAQNNINVIRQTCEVKNQCDLYCAPNDKQRKCVQSNPYPDDQYNWVAPFHCSCKGNFSLTSDNKTCTDVCENVKCNNHGKCKYKGLTGFACECDEGWSGELCNNEYKAALGGWIAGIVILAVLVVIASGVALIFARRSRNSEYSNNHSGHQMDDYTGTSYRVGQSNTGAARSQPGYQGRDNQAFHRD